MGRGSGAVVAEGCSDASHLTRPDQMALATQYHSPRPPNIKTKCTESDSGACVCLSVGE